MIGGAAKKQGNFEFLVVFVVDCRVNDITVIAVAEGQI
jgi:hypothetical protein